MERCPVDPIAAEADVAVGNAEIVEKAGVKATDILGERGIGAGVVVGPGLALGGLVILQ